MLSDTFLRIPLGEIHVKRDERQRREISSDDLHSSIRARGVLQPIIVQRSDTGDAGYILIAGERRLHACQHLGIKDIPARLVDELSTTERQIIELEENVKRRDLHWKDEMLALGKIYRLSKAADPNITQEKVAESIGMERNTLTRYLAIEEELVKGNKNVHAAAGPQAAYNIVARMNERALGDVMNEFLSSPRPLDIQVSAPVATASKTLSEPPPIDEALDIRITNFHEFAASYSGVPFNLLHCDFPYGIGHHKSDQGRSAQWSGYGDTDDDYWNLCETLCTHVDRLVAPSAHIIFWLSCDIERQYETLQFFRVRAPSLEFRSVPIYWHKTDNRGILPDYNRGPRQIVETALIASRGDRPIIRAVGNAYGAPTTKEVHQSEKPEPMLRHFFQMFVDGDTRLLDPTCGSGSALRAAESLGAKSVLGLEISEDYAKAARDVLRRFRLLRKVS